MGKLFPEFLDRRNLFFNCQEIPNKVAGKLALFLAEYGGILSLQGHPIWRLSCER